jgi:hypothetical protein
MFISLCIVVKEIFLSTSKILSNWLLMSMPNLLFFLAYFLHLFGFIARCKFQQYLFCV